MQEIQERQAIPAMQVKKVKHLMQEMQVRLAHLWVVFKIIAIICKHRNITAMALWPDQGSSANPPTDIRWIFLVKLTGERSDESIKCRVLLWYGLSGYFFIFIYILLLFSLITFNSTNKPYECGSGFVPILQNKPLLLSWLKPELALFSRINGSTFLRQTHFLRTNWDCPVLPAIFLLLLFCASTSHSLSWWVDF